MTIPGTSKFIMTTLNTGCAPRYGWKSVSVNNMRISNCMVRHVLPDETVFYIYTHRTYRMHGHNYHKTRYEDSGEMLLICQECRHILKVYTGGYGLKKIRVYNKSGLPVREDIRTCNQVKMEEALG